MKYILLCLLLVSCVSEQQKRREAAIIAEFCMSEADAKAPQYPAGLGLPNNKAEWTLYYSLCMQRHGQ